MSDSLFSDPKSGIRPARKRGLPARLRNYFLTGVVASVPLIITFYLLFWFIDWVDGWYDALVPAPYHLENHLPFPVPGLGVLFALVAFTLFGACAANIIGRSVLRFGERLVARMPVVRAVYGALKQILETIFTTEKMSFQRVGLIPYPRPGLYALVFIADETRGEIPRRLGEKMSTVFVPTTPNPTSGFLLFVPSGDVMVLDLSVEAAATMIVSLGLVMPDGPAEGVGKEGAEADAREAPPVAV